MTHKITLDINLDDMIQKYMDYNDEYSDINSYIKYHLSRDIQSLLTKRLEEKLWKDIDGYSTEIFRVAKDTWQSSINERIKTTIDKAFSNSLQEYIDNKLRWRVNSIIDSYIKDYLDNKLMKSLQDFISGIVVVNSSDIEEERKALEWWAYD